MTRILISGGGTGGHIAPALAVAEALDSLSPGVEVFFVSSPRPVDRRMYAPFEGRVRVLDPPRIDRGPAARLLLPFGALSAFLRARRVVKELRPRAILSTGGYASFFCAAAGASLGIPVLLHESNSIPGRANRLAARFARRVLVGFECAAGRFGSKAIYTGNPVRQSLEVMPAGEARSLLGLEGCDPVVLMLGGSQGASRINSLAVSAPPGVSVVLQCGEREYPGMAAQARPGLAVLAFEDRPGMLYCAADLAVARAGAMTLAELSAFGLPAVLVPYPHAADGHQSVNAAVVASKGGAVVVEERDLEPDRFWSEVSALLSDRPRIGAMSRDIRGCFPAGSAERVARMVLEAAGEAV